MPDEWEKFTKSKEHQPIEDDGAKQGNRFLDAWFRNKYDTYTTIAMVFTFLAVMFSDPPPAWESPNPFVRAKWWFTATVGFASLAVMIYSVIRSLQTEYAKHSSLIAYLAIGVPLLFGFYFLLAINGKL